jgi:hypothetical protein
VRVALPALDDHPRMVELPRVVGCALGNCTLARAAMHTRCPERVISRPELRGQRRQVLLDKRTPSTGSLTFPDVKPLIEKDFSGEGIGAESSFTNGGEAMTAEEDEDTSTSTTKITASKLWL